VNVLSVEQVMSELPMPASGYSVCEKVCSPELFCLFILAFLHFQGYMHAFTSFPDHALS
jgi:hypothetical protein